MDQPNENIPVIKEPDLSKIPTLNLVALMAITVVDDPTSEDAAAKGQTVKDIISQVQAEFEAPKKAAHKLHKWLCDAEKKALAPLQCVFDHLEKQLSAYLPKRDEALKQLKAKIEEAQEELSPWEREPVVVPFTPPPSGVKDHFKPWSFRLDSLADLLEAISADPALRKEIADAGALEPNSAFWTAKAREMQADLSRRYPGVIGVREKKKVL